MRIWLSSRDLYFCTLNQLLVSDKLIRTINCEFLISDFTKTLLLIKNMLKIRERE